MPRQTSDGVGLFATRSFSEGDVIYTSKMILVELRMSDLRKVPCTLLYKDASTNTTINLETVLDQSVCWWMRKKMSDDLFIFEQYEFDSFMNHSCFPNVRIVQDTMANTYSCVAISQIHPGDEILMNYLEYDLPRENLVEFICNCCGRQIGTRHV
jgi:hypothetical protein